MPDFDLAGALFPRGPVPFCATCDERMRLLSCYTGERAAGFSLARTCQFACKDPACETMAVKTVPLLVARVTQDGEPLGRGALRALSTGRCPWCLSISGPSHNSEQYPENGLYLTWDCDDCLNHWEEHLELA